MKRIPTLMILVAIATFAMTACNGGKRGGAKGGAAEGKPTLDFNALDTNTDGQISESEAGKAWRKLSRADTDKSGSISKAEFEARTTRPARPAE